MIGSLSGKIDYLDGSLVLIEVGDVGYRIQLPERIIKKIKVGDKARFYTYTYVKEDALELFGFENIHDLKLFENLLRVSGVGPKTALGVFSAGTREEIINATVTGDVSFFEKVPRLGRKNAQKIIIELKNKFGNLDDLDLSDKDIKENNDIVLALRSFGFSPSEAKEAIKSLDGSQKTLDEKIKESLKYLGR
ncbi:MAG: Holliday junction branch migration protein RuvA [Candidatus Levybacteria bacterium]|nr:Holliday junction branch migration protein RuvA [Candidatus Levybacteria bacterium]